MNKFEEEPAAVFLVRDSMRRVRSAGAGTAADGPRPPPLGRRKR